MSITGLSLLYRYCGLLGRCVARGGPLCDRRTEHFETSAKLAWYVSLEICSSGSGHTIVQSNTSAVRISFVTKVRFIQWSPAKPVQYSCYLTLFRVGEMTTFILATYSNAV